MASQVYNKNEILDIMTRFIMTMNPELTKKASYDVAINWWDTIYEPPIPDKFEKYLDTLIETDANVQTREIYSTIKTVYLQTK